MRGLHWMMIVGLMLCSNHGLAKSETSHTIGDHTFPKTLERDGVSLLLKSGTHYRYMSMFDVLSAGIYLPADVPAKDFVKMGSKALRLCYDRKFSAEEFSKVTVDFMKDNNPLEVVNQVRKEIDVFNSLYEAVVPGDCYALFYAKGKGLVFYKNDRVLGTPGQDKFAEAVFRIWFGPKPFSSGMRDDLLEGKI